MPDWPRTQKPASLAFITACDQLNHATVVNYTFYFQTFLDLHNVAFQCTLQQIYPFIFNNESLPTGVVYGHFSGGLVVSM